MASNFGIIMAEIDVGGIKFKGGKIFVVLTILSTLAGGLWTGFIFYKDYLDMKDQVQEYTAPDLSGFDKRIDLIQQEVEMITSELSMIMDEVSLVADVAKELKNDLKSDVRRIETIVEDVEQRVKEDSRTNAKELKEVIKDIEDDMIKLEEAIDKRIKLTLDNPLSQMK
jgi:DNA anti-recombination protein RmuC